MLERPSKKDLRGVHFAVSLFVATTLLGPVVKGVVGIAGAWLFATVGPLARIKERFPLVCPLCAAEMRISVFVTAGPIVRDISPSR